MTRRAALACSLVLLAAGCQSSPSVHGCAADVDCGPGNLCHRGSCAGNVPPSATFSAPVAATTNRLVSLVATSTDPEGRPVEHRWSITAVAAGCDPEQEPGDGPGLDVVFWCPGTYEATLVPVDDLGAEGPSVTQTFAVTGATGVPTLSVGAAIPAQHRCDPEVPSCVVLAPDGTPSLRLAASGADPGGKPLTYEWMVIPPAAAATDPALEPTFAPGAFDAAPTATIGNSGGPIAGRYRFRVRVASSLGLLAQAFQEVVVENHPPVAAPAAALVLEHRYVDGVYLAEGDVDTGASDPDGDLLFAAGALTPAAPAGCTEEVTPASGGKVHVRIACSLTTALVRADLRSLAVAISDANGAEVAFTSPLEIANQPPSITLRPDFTDGLLAIEHRVEACAVASGTACFVADAADPFVVVDPDGDPLSGYRLGVTVSPDRTSSYGTASVDGADYRFRFETPTSLPAEFRSDTNATGFTVSASVTDAFGAATGVALPLAVLNRAPTVLEAVAAAEIPHGYDLATRSYRASADGPLFADPDGDPLVPSVLPSTVCSRVTLDQGRANLGCELAWDFMVGGVPPLASFLGARSIPVTASDGWQRATSVVAVTILDRPATISTPTRVIENCGCFKEPDACGYWAPWGAVRVPVQVVDPDGDPALVTALASRSIVDPPVPIMCPGGWCYPAAAFLETSATGVAKATSGEGISASAPFSVTVTCVSSNLPCGCP